MGAPRLSEATLDRLPPEIRRPAYDRRRHGVGIVHLGLGAFHRAHQAIYTEDAIACAGGDWRIAAATMRSAGAAERLAPQDGLYTLVERSPTRPVMRVVGALAEAMAGDRDPAAVVRRMADPAVQVVTLTVTEKGYGLDPETGGLDLADPRIARDLDRKEPPRSAVGMLISALAIRRARGLSPFTALSCDNLANNGAVLKRLAVQFAAEHDPGLAEWIALRARFPNAMVDRITPATTAADIEEVARMTGLFDAAAVVAEPFSQWVIEDRFASDRPRWEEAGAMMVDDVRPFEAAKLRLLNGGHSALAYLGLAAGCATVDEAVRDPRLRGYLERLMRDELSPTLVPAPGLDLARYRTALLARFGNPGLGHRLSQIAADGSRKLPQRLLAPLAERWRRGEASPAILLAVAGWLRHVQGANGAVDDPLAERLAVLWTRAAGDVAQAVNSILATEGLFPGALRDDPRVAAQLARLTRGLLEGRLDALLDEAVQAERAAR